MYDQNEYETLNTAEQVMVEFANDCKFSKGTADLKVRQSKAPCIDFNASSLTDAFDETDAFFVQIARDAGQMPVLV